MEIRKLQKTGGSSYIVSLPKEWIRNVFEVDGSADNDKSVKKDRMKVGIIEREDNALILFPFADVEKSQRVKSIDADGNDQTFIYRMLVGSYITGFNLIKVHSKTRLTTEAHETCRKFIRDAIGLEIIEETQKQLTIKDLLNPNQIEFTSWIERISNLVSNQIELSLEALKKRDEDQARIVVSRDLEVNRINWLLARQHNILMKNPLILDKLDSRERIDVNYSWISRIIERIGDHAVSLAKQVLVLITTHVDEKHIDKVIKAGKTVNDIFKASMSTFFYGGLNDANAIIERVPNASEMCQEIKSISLSLHIENGLAMAQIGSDIKRMGEHSADLCEYIINYLIEHESKTKK